MTQQAIKRKVIKQDNNPLFKVQCRTFAVARKLVKSKNNDVIGLNGEHPFTGFRCYPQHRTEQAKALRKKVFFYIMLVGRENLK